MRVTVTAQLYGQFLVSSQVNYTGPYLADHLDGLTHDNGRYFLKTQRFPPATRPLPKRKAAAAGRLSSFTVDTSS